MACALLVCGNSDCKNGFRGKGLTATPFAFWLMLKAAWTTAFGAPPRTELLASLLAELEPAVVPRTPAAPAASSKAPAQNTA